MSEGHSSKLEKKVVLKQLERTLLARAESVGPEKSSLSVALLMEDVVEARKLSKIFRKAQVMPYIYQSLQEFWEDVFTHRPSLTVIDVKMMSSQNLLLLDHPLVKAKKLALSFYYDQESTPLLHSTYEVAHLGLIHKDLYLKGQVKSVLTRFNEMSEAKATLKSLKLKQERVDSQISGLLTQLESYKETHFFNKYTDDIIETFESLKDVTSFEDAVDRVFSHLKDVKAFSFYELSKSGQKLMSAHISSAKFKNLPPVWLGQNNSQGISNQGQLLAQQVGVEVHGDELMALSVYGEYRNPDKLILLRLSDDELFDKISWDRIELYLSGLYARLTLAQRSSVSQMESEMSQWKLLSTIDGHFYDRQAEEASQDQLALIGVDFSKLVDFLVSQKMKTRFHWNEFYQDFFSRFEKQHKLSVQTASFGVRFCTLLCSSDESEKVFSLLKSFIARYPLWRYFEDVDVILAHDFRPEVQMIPLSSYAVISYMNRAELAAQESQSTDNHRIAVSQMKKIENVENSRPRGRYRFLETNQ